MKTLSIKRLAASAVVLAGMLALTGCPSGDTTKKAVGTVTKKTVETAKGVFSGIAEGVDEGRKQTTGVDGASVVMTFAEMKDKVNVEILGVEEDPAREVVSISIGLANITEGPIRVSGLSASDGVMLIDKSGYVNRVIRGPLDVTIPANAKEKTTLVFTGKAADYVTLRLLGGEVSLAGTPITTLKTEQTQQAQ